MPCENGTFADVRGKGEQAVCECETRNMLKSKLSFKFAMMDLVQMTSLHQLMTKARERHIRSHNSINPSKAMRG